MPRSMIPFPYSPWPFLDFGQDPDPNGAPPVPYVPGVTIPWSILPPVAPQPPAPPLPAPPPIVPPTNSPAPQPMVPPSDTPGFDKTFAPQPPPPPVAQAPRNPSLADIIAPWMQPPEPEPPPPALPPSETPGLDKAIARINAPTPGFHLTPGLGGFTQPPMWSLPPPPQLLSMPPLPIPSGGGLGALASHLPPLAPAPSPLTLAGNVSAPTMPQPGVGPGIPETLTQLARRPTPFATQWQPTDVRTLSERGPTGIYYVDSYQRPPAPGEELANRVPNIFAKTSGHLSADPSEVSDASLASARSDGRPSVAPHSDQTSPQEESPNPGGVQIAQIEISPHALMRMQQKGISSEQLMDAINNGTRTIQANGNTRCVGSAAVVILSPRGSVITCFPR